MIEFLEGHPLWNGRDEIFIRKAFPEEEAQFDASQARAIKDEEIDEDDDWTQWTQRLTPTIAQGARPILFGRMRVGMCPTRRAPARDASNELAGNPALAGGGSGDGDRRRLRGLRPRRDRAEKSGLAERQHPMSN
jgi:hypothetical protein